MLFVLGFVAIFVLGGLSGVTLAAVPFDLQVNAPLGLHAFGERDVPELVLLDHRREIHLDDLIVVLAPEQIRHHDPL